MTNKGAMTNRGQGYSDGSKLLERFPEMAMRSAEDSDLIMVI